MAIGILYRNCFHCLSSSALVYGGEVAISGNSILASVFLQKPSFLINCLDSTRAKALGFEVMGCLQLNCVFKTTEHLFAKLNKEKVLICTLAELSTDTRLSPRITEK